MLSSEKEQAAGRDNDDNGRSETETSLPVPDVPPEGGLPLSHSLTSLCRCGYVVDLCFASDRAF
jgi:hypothetical protein